MNKAELTDAVASSSDLTKADAERDLDATIDAISGSLASGDHVALVVFGTFSVRYRTAR